MRPRVLSVLPKSAVSSMASSARASVLSPWPVLPGGATAVCARCEQRRQRSVLALKRIPRAHTAAPKLAAHRVDKLKIAGRELAISNPDKVLFPRPNYTKLDLVRYYMAVAEGALRGAGGRPNMLVRYPEGIEGEHFYQKQIGRAHV